MSEIQNMMASKYPSKYPILKEERQSSPPPSSSSWSIQLLIILIIIVILGLALKKLK